MGFSISLHLLQQLPAVQARRQIFFCTTAHKLRHDDKVSGIMIGLLDYGMGNLRSVEKALERAGATVQRLSRGSDLPQARALVVPGQGAFRDCAAHLKEHGLWEPLQQWLREDKPFLGICLGQQVLFQHSYENGTHEGLGFFPGSVSHFFSTPENPHVLNAAVRPTADLKVPQIGWNRVHYARADCPLFEEIPDGSYFYFDHSYTVRPSQRADIAGETSYGETFASVVWRGRCYAVQFHPEKSQRVGLKLIENFVKNHSA